MNGLLGQAFNVLGSSVPNLFLDQGSYQGFLKDYHDFCALEDEEGALEIPDHTDTPAFETLEFRNVCFTYPGDRKTDFEGLLHDDSPRATIMRSSDKTVPERPQ